MGACLHDLDKRFAGNTALETTELFGGDDHDLVAAMRGDVLGKSRPHRSLANGR